jgi:hypothetical protein
MRLTLIIFFFAILPLSAFEQNPFYWSEPENIEEINTPENDFAPRWNPYDSLLFFNSEINNYSEFYSVDYPFSSPQPVLVNGQINQRRDNRSYISFESRDRAIISSYRLSENGRSYFNLFRIGQKRGEWLPPVLIDSLMTDHFCAHPTISPDGRNLVFVSTKNSLYGDTDIWIAYKQNSSWGNAIPLEELNTPGNEITPFFVSKDTLYFASDGHDGPGGYDIFVSVYSNGKWQRPDPVFELNTQFNESDFAVLPDGNAIFSSDRPGGKGKLDLYLTKKQANNLAKHETVPTEISINASTDQILVEAELHSSKHQLIPYVFLGDDIKKYSLKKNLYTVSSSLDSIQKYSLSYLSAEMKKSPDAVLFIRGQVGGKSLDKEKIGEILSAFENVYDIDSSRVILKSVSTGNSETTIDHLVFDTNIPYLFKPISIDSGSYELEPSMINIDLSSRPLGSVDSWECRLFVGNAVDTVIAGGSILPYSFSLDIRKYANVLYHHDSLNLHFTCRSQGDEITESTTIFVSRSSQSERKYNWKSGKKAIQYSITALNADHLSLQSNSRIMREILLSAGIGKKITVEYSGSKDIANRLKDLIESGSGKRVEVKKTTSLKESGFRKKYSEYIFDVLIFVD